MKTYRLLETGDLIQKGDFIEDEYRNWDSADEYAGQPADNNDYVWRPVHAPE